MSKGKITGIGGVFFRSNDPDKSKQWYADSLGLNLNDYGAMFASSALSDPSSKVYTQWSPFPRNTDYFGDSDQEFMINYRVQNLEDLVADMRAKGVELIGDIESYSYGKFAYFKDLDGRKVELWEPVAGVFDGDHPSEKINHE